jgi:CDGSH-type Zn-finger protein
MEDTRKSAAAAAIDVQQDAKQKPQEDRETFVAFMNEPVADTSPGQDDSVTGKALDRWFRERQKQQGSPRMLEIPNEAVITNGGPIHITGNLTLVREDGSVEYANHLSLCRCGHSSTKPTCDDAHLDREFLHSGKFSSVSEVPPTDRPSKVTFTLVRNGPVTYRGRVKLLNQFGQECMKMRGALCRCGQSANKPFCDGSHERSGFKTSR